MMVMEGWRQAIKRALQLPVMPDKLMLILDSSLAAVADETLCGFTSVAECAS